MGWSHALSCRRVVAGTPVAGALVAGAFVAGWAGELQGQAPDAAFVARLEVSHTVPEAAGRVFARVAPKLAVAYHLGQPDELLDEIERGVRSSYSGPFLIAEDLVTVEVGDSVKVVRRR